MRWDAISGTFRVYEKGGGGGTSTTTQTVQNFSPEEAAARNAVQSEAQRIYNATSGQITNAPYPGATPAPASTPTLQGQNAALTAAGTQANMAGQLSAAQGFGLYDVLFPQTNPALRASVDAAVRPVTQAYTDPGGVLSQIRTDSMNAGQYGGSRQSLALGVAGGRYLDTVGDISARMHSDAYNKGLDTFSRTMALAPQNIQAQTAPAQTLSAVGQQQEAYQQQQLDYDAAVRQWSMNAPWAALQNYANIVYGGSTPGTSSTSFSSGGSGGSTAMSALGGAAMGASIGSMIPGIGTAVGAGVGLMMGLFS
jgi:hypothetical protein